jgi:hypothetical protein
MLIISNLDYSPHALARFGCFLPGDLPCSFEHTRRRPSCDDLVDETGFERFSRREAMSLEREFANDGAPGQLGTRDRGERNGPRRAKVDLVHAHPGATLGSVDHDAVIARESDDGTGGEAVAVDGCDGWNFEWMDELYTHQYGKRGQVTYLER